MLWVALKGVCVRACVPVCVCACVGHMCHVMGSDFSVRDFTGVLPKSATKIPVNITNLQWLLCQSCADTHTHKHTDTRCLQGLISNTWAEMRGAVALQTVQYHNSDVNIPSLRWLIFTVQAFFLSFCWSFYACEDWIWVSPQSCLNKNLNWFLYPLRQEKNKHLNLAKHTQVNILIYARDFHHQGMAIGFFWGSECFGNTYNATLLYFPKR